MGKSVRRKSDGVREGGLSWRSEKGKEGVVVAMKTGREVNILLLLLSDFAKESVHIFGLWDKKK